ncbi:MAG: TonB-dependent receptor [Ignavibacteriaceae bacterium]
MKNLIVILISIHFTIGLTFAQTYNISGRVTGDGNISLAGVNIIILETGTGTASEHDGTYIINNLLPGSYTVKYSFIGYREELRNIEIINDNLLLNIILSSEAVESEQVIVSAGKYEQNISELPVSAEIMPAEEIIRRNISNVEEAMRYIPGINMTDDQVSIRGSSGYSRGAGTRVLLAIDGIPYYTGDTGEIIWQIIPVNQIKRIEVIKGAASSLYGSSAIGGVINIITNSITKEPQTYIRALFGVYDKPSYSEWDWSGEYRKFNGFTLSHSNSIDKFDFSAGLTRLEDEGYRQSGFYHRYIGSFKGVYNFSAVSSLNLIFNSINQRNGNYLYWKDSHNVLVPPDADQGQRVASNRYMFGAAYKTLMSETFFLNIRASYYNTHWRDQTVSANNSKTDLIRGEIQSTYLLNSNMVIISGVEASYADVNSNIFGVHDSKAAGIYTQADIHFSIPLLLSIGARFDYTELDTIDSFSNFSPKLGLNYNLSDNLILRSSVGTGFRSPTLSEAFTSTNASGIVIKPNPDLKPETNLSVEFGFNYQPLNWLNIDAAVFQNEFYDFIEPGVDLNDGLIFFDNVTRARIQGYELNTGISLFKNLKLSVNYTYLWTRDIEKRRALKYRPRHITSAGLDYTMESFSAGADFRYWSRVEEIDNELIDLGLVPDGELRDDVFVLDLRAGYNFANSNLPLRLFLTVKNALNYNYVELIGNLEPLRNISIGAEVLF